MENVTFDDPIHLLSTTDRDTPLSPATYQHRHLIATAAGDTFEYRGSNATDRVQSIQSEIVFWGIVDGILVVTIIGGNILTMLAVRYSRRLRSVISNMFVLSLAISDIVVGFTLPYHLAFYMGSNLGQFKYWCMLRFFLIILACSVSIWNLTAIAVDRYIAIMYPLHYTRYTNCLSDRNVERDREFKIRQPPALFSRYYYYYLRVFLWWRN